MTGCWLVGSTAAAVACAGAVRGTARAQPLRDPAVTIAVVAGGGPASLSGSAFGATRPPLSPGVLQSRPGRALGLAVAVPVRWGFALRPELLFTRRGGHVGYVISGIPHDYSGPLDEDLRLTAVEVPVLLEYAPLGRGWLQPRVYAGPAWVHLRDCALTYTYGGTDGATVGCDAPRVSGVFRSPRANSWPAVIGAEVRVRLPGRALPILTVGVRDDRGRTDLQAQAAALGTVRTRLLAYYGGIAIGLGRAGHAQRGGG